MTNASLKRHKKLIHKIDSFSYCIAARPITGTFSTSIETGIRNLCPVAECSGSATNRYRMYRHFAYIHPEATLIVDGVSLPKCSLCKMHHKNMDKHMNTDICKTLQGRRINEEKERLQAEAEDVNFFVNGIEIERVTHFNYLGRRVDQDDSDSNCIQTNIRKARKQWSSISKLLKREGANAVIMTRFYRTIVQSVLLYGAESWTPKRSDIRKLNSFHHRAARYMTRVHIKFVNEKWIFPDHSELLKKCGMVEIERYIEARRYTLRGYVEKITPIF